MNNCIQTQRWENGILTFPWCNVLLSKSADLKWVSPHSGGSSSFLREQIPGSPSRAKFQLDSFQYHWCFRWQKCQSLNHSFHILVYLVLNNNKQDIQWWKYGSFPLDYSRPQRLLSIQPSIYQKISWIFTGLWKMTISSGNDGKQGHKWQISLFCSLGKFDQTLVPLINALGRTHYFSILPFTKLALEN